MELPLIRGEYKHNYDLSRLTWFKVGGMADILFKPADTDDLADFLRQNKGQLPVTIIGAGSNVIVRDGGIEGVVVKLGRNFTKIELLENGDLAAHAGCLNFNLAKFVTVHGIKGFEFLIGIPGTIGGGIAMNAGAYGAEFKDIVNSIVALDPQGNEHEFSCEEARFSYRKNNLPDNLIFTKVIFNTKQGDETEINQKMQQIMKNRAETQPIAEKTGGSTFANPEGARAWELVDAAGLRGERIGGALMSQKHCNFMINKGNATASDMENLGELVQEKVKAHSGIELKWEIKRIGRR